MLQSYGNMQNRSALDWGNLGRANGSAPSVSTTSQRVGANGSFYPQMGGPTTTTTTTYAEPVVTGFNNGGVMITSGDGETRRYIASSTDLNSRLRKINFSNQPCGSQVVAEKYGKPKTQTSQECVPSWDGGQVCTTTTRTTRELEAQKVQKYNCDEQTVGIDDGVVVEQRQAYYDPVTGNAITETRVRPNYKATQRIVTRKPAGKPYVRRVGKEDTDDETMVEADLDNIDIEEELEKFERTKQRLEGVIGRLQDKLKHTRELIEKKSKSKKRTTEHKTEAKEVKFALSQAKDDRDKLTTAIKLLSPSKAGKTKAKTPSPSQTAKAIAAAENVVSTIDGARARAAGASTVPTTVRKAGTGAGTTSSIQATTTMDSKTAVNTNKKVPRTAGNKDDYELTAQEKADGWVSTTSSSWGDNPSWVDNNKATWIQNTSGSGAVGDEKNIIYVTNANGQISKYRSWNDVQWQPATWNDVNMDLHPTFYRSDWQPVYRNPLRYVLTATTKKYGWFPFNAKNRPQGFLAESDPLFADYFGFLGAFLAKPVFEGKTVQKIDKGDTINTLENLILTALSDSSKKVLLHKNDVPSNAKRFIAIMHPLMRLYLSPIIYDVSKDAQLSFYDNQTPANVTLEGWKAMYREPKDGSEFDTTLNALRSLWKSMQTAWKTHLQSLLQSQNGSKVGGGHGQTRHAGMAWDTFIAPQQNKESFYDSLPLAEATIVAVLANMQYNEGVLLNVHLLQGFDKSILTAGSAFMNRISRDLRNYLSFSYNNFTSSQNAFVSTSQVTSTPSFESYTPTQWVRVPNTLKTG